MNPNICKKNCTATIKSVLCVRTRPATKKITFKQTITSGSIKTERKLWGILNFPTSALNFVEPPSVVNHVQMSLMLKYIRQVTLSTPSRSTHSSMNRAIVPLLDHYCLISLIFKVNRNPTNSCHVVDNLLEIPDNKDEIPTPSRYILPSTRHSRLLDATRFRNLHSSFIHNQYQLCCWYRRYRHQNDDINIDIEFWKMLIQSWCQYRRYRAQIDDIDIDIDIHWWSCKINFIVDIERLTIYRRYRTQNDDILNNSDLYNCIKTTITILIKMTISTPILTQIKSFKIIGITCKN